MNMDCMPFPFFVSEPERKSAFKVEKYDVISGTRY